MNKAKAYPWIFAIMGLLIGLIILITTTFNYNFFILNTIVFGITFGCIYGRLIEQSKGAIIIGGIVGGLFGLHPMSLYCFVFGGAYVSPLLKCLSLRGEENGFRWGTYLFFCAIVGAVMVAFLSSIGVNELNEGGGNELTIGPVIGGAIIGMLPVTNILFVVTSSFWVDWDTIGGYSVHWANWLIIAPLFIVPLLAFIGYGIGKIAEKRAEEKEKLEVYKTKIEQWKTEGYDVSELEEILK